MDKNVLIVVAHPDDEALGCGGTIVHHVTEGDTVYCLILGEGAMSRADSEEYNKDMCEGVRDNLRDSALKSASILGMKGVKFQNLPDNQFDSVPLLKIVKMVEGLKEIFKPDIIYTHSYYDLNIDHRITLEAVLTATRPTSGETVKEIYSFEVPSSSEWNFGKFFKPNVFVDVTETFAYKIKALKCYSSELREYPHPRSIRGIEIIARRWGLNVGVKYAESFELLRILK